MPKEIPDDTEIETQEQPNAGHEAEADADAQVKEPDDIGDDGEGAAEGDGSEAEEGEELAAIGDDEKPARSRGETRFQKLANEAKEAREEAARVRRELDEFRMSQRREAQQESPDQIAQRLALMTPEERLEYKLDQAERRNQQQMQQMAFTVQDQSDQSKFAALCATDSIAARYKDRVETRLREIRAQGQNVNREALLDYLVGQDIRAKGGGAKAKQKRDGERRIERQSVKPGAARGDSAANRRDEQSREEKLANVTF